MDDRLYQEALRRREELRKELEDIEGFIQLAERLFRERSTPRASENSESVEAASVRNTSDDHSTRRRSSSSPAQLAALAREEIEAHGKPMTRSELVDALEKRGVEVVAKDKAKNLGTILWRYSNTFINIPGEGYWLRDVPPPGKMV